MAPQPPRLVAPPSTHPTMDYAYQTHELINLELMKRHETNLWRAYNQDTDQAHASLVLASQALSTGLEQTKTKRKRERHEHAQEVALKKRQLYKLLGSVASVRKALD